MARRARLLRGFFTKSAALGFTLSAFLLLASLAAAQEVPPGSEAAPGDVLVVTISYKDAAERDRLANEFDALEVATSNGKLTIWTDRAGYDQMRARGLKVKIDRAATRLANAPFADDSGDRSIATVFGGYRTVEEVYAFLADTAEQHSTLAELVDVGDSWCKTHPGACTQPAPFDGYDLLALRITNTAVPGPKPVFWFDASVHARELATTEVATRFISWLLDNYTTNADAHWLVDHHDIWVMPLANPDGRHIVEGGGNNPWSQRKSSDHDDGCTVFPPTGTTQFGTDLNRNFPFRWGGGGSSGSPCSQTYRGPSAASADETQAILAAIRSLIPDQRGTSTTAAAPLTATGIVQSLHSYGNLNLYPWGHTTSLAPNGADLRNIARHMSARNAGGNGYQPCQPPACLYGVDGDTADWGYGELGIPSYTTELEGGTFFPAYSSIDSAVWPNNRGMLIYLARIARTPYLLARGPDANSVAVSAPSGGQVQLTATINYNWTNNAYRQNVAAAQYYLDTPPWAGGTAVAMQPADGRFNSVTEPVTATIPTAALTPGRHILFVRGRGTTTYSGNQSWGPISAVFLDVP